MFDISWTEFLLIGVVALIVIGPKELPAVLRTLGQWTRKVRGMAADFQNQFQEAMREAEMADLKKEVDDLAKDIKQYDPLKEVRAEVEAAGHDIRGALDREPEAPVLADAAAPAAVAEAAGKGTAMPAAGMNGVGLADAAAATVAADAVEPSAVQSALPVAGADAAESLAAATGPALPQAADTPTPADNTGRAG